MTRRGGVRYNQCVRYVRFALALASVLFCAAPASALAASDCATDGTFHWLDFWLGTWRVTANGAYAGTDAVTSDLGGCAVDEHWTDADGSRGQGLFFYDSFAGRWNQIWLTEQSAHVGGLKYKTLVGRFPDGSVRFQGLLPAPAGRPPILDRTTLTPVRDGTVRQVIEISRDGGTTWSVTFDAVYTRIPAS